MEVSRDPVSDGPVTQDAVSQGADPAVSVLMAVRDGEIYLPATLASLAEMEAPPGGAVEFVVVDDGSSDSTPELLRAWSARDARVRVLTKATPIGLPAALNEGIEATRAPLVARADADDLYAADRLVRQAERFTRDRELGVLSCGYTRIGPGGERLGVVRPPTGPDVIRFRMLFMNPLLHPGVMFRREIVRAAGGYDPDYWTAQDSELWARLAETVPMDNIEDPLVEYRVHQRSVMKRRGASGAALSLTVPARMQSIYLGGLPEDHDVAATVRLFQGYEPMGRREVERGLAGLSTIDSIAARREPPAVMADFLGRSARSLLRHAGSLKMKSPVFALRLAARATAWRRRAQQLRAERPSRAEDGR